MSNTQRQVRYLRSALQGEIQEKFGGTAVEKSPHFLEISTERSGQVSQSIIFSNVRLSAPPLVYPVQCSVHTTYTEIEQSINTILNRDGAAYGMTTFSVNLAVFPSPATRIDGFVYPLSTVDEPILAIAPLVNDFVNGLSPIARKMVDPVVLLDHSFAPPTLAKSCPNWTWVVRQAIYIHLYGKKSEAEAFFADIGRWIEAETLLYEPAAAAPLFGRSTIADIVMKGESRAFQELRKVMAVLPARKPGSTIEFVDDNRPRGA